MTTLQHFTSPHVKAVETDRSRMGLREKVSGFF